MCEIVLKRRCPICGNMSGVKLHEILMKLQDKMPIPGNYDVVACAKCGFTYADVDASQTDYDNYYKNYNIYAGTGNIRATDYDIINNFRIRLFEKYVSKDLKILDIGFGSGAWLKILKNSNYNDLFGLDPSESSVYNLSELGLKGDIANIFDEVEEERIHFFDVCCLTAVLEHIYDVNIAIAQMKKYIKKNSGMIFVDVPNIDGIQYYYSPVPNNFNQEHINYFTLASLDYLMQLNGFVRVNQDEEANLLLKSTVTTPCLMGLYKLNQSISCEKDYFDITGKNAINRYFLYADKDEERMHCVINDVLKENEEGIVVWGIGAQLSHLLEVVPSLKSKIAYCVDNNKNKWGIKFEGITVISPDCLQKDHIENAILICSMFYSSDIEKQIRQMGLMNKVYKF